MDSGIKVGKEVAAFIEDAKEFYSYQGNWIEGLIEDHTEAIAEDWEHAHNEALVMKQYSVEQLKDILHNGYVVE